MSVKKIHMVCLNTVGSGISGSDRICIEVAKGFVKAGHKVSLFISDEMYRICQREAVQDFTYHVMPTSRYNKWGFYLGILIRTVLGRRFAARHHDCDIVYTASDFWPDVMPGALMKRLNKGCSWIAGMYMFAPNPFIGFDFLREKKQWRIPRLNMLGYHAGQAVTLRMMQRSADLISVTYDGDKEIFVKRGVEAGRIQSIFGGIDLEWVGSIPPLEGRRYDGCFVGRLHQQKIPLELVDIWEEVVNKRRDAKLAVIGVGPLEEEMRRRVDEKGLAENVEMLGFMDGKEKFQVLKSSKMLLCTEVYHSGGLTPAEAMGCKLPVVAYSIPPIRQHYPEGIVWVAERSRRTIDRTPRIFIRGFILPQSPRNRAVGL